MVGKNLAGLEKRNEEEYGLKEQMLSYVQKECEGVQNNVEF